MTTADRYRRLSVSELFVWMQALGVPWTRCTRRVDTFDTFEATIQPLHAWRVLKSGERKLTPISFAGVKYRIEKRHGELLSWNVASMNGDVQIAFRVLRDGL